MDYCRDIPFREYKIHKRKPLRVNANGITNMSRTRAEVDSSSSSTIPTAYRTVLYYQQMPLGGKKKPPNAPPKTKCAPASNWHFSIVRPRDSRTTLRPNATTSNMKKDNAFRPASRMATGGDVSRKSENGKWHLTYEKEHCGSRAFTMSVEIAVVS